MSVPQGRYALVRSAFPTASHQSRRSVRASAKSPFWVCRTRWLSATADHTCTATSVLSKQIVNQFLVHQQKSKLMRFARAHTDLVRRKWLHTEPAPGSSRQVAKTRGLLRTDPSCHLPGRRWATPNDVSFVQSKHSNDQTTNIQTHQECVSSWNGFSRPYFIWLCHGVLDFRLHKRGEFSRCVASTGRLQSATDHKCHS